MTTTSFIVRWRPRGLGAGRSSRRVPPTGRIVDASRRHPGVCIASVSAAAVTVRRGGDMKTKRFARASSRLPRRGHVLVTITVVDENGFTSQYETVEAPVGALREGVAAIHLAAVEAGADAGSASA